MPGCGLVNKTTSQNLAKKAVYANSFWQRAKGLLGKASLARGEALFIPQCRSIHTFFMLFSIDLIFVDKNNKVLKTVQDLAPFRMAFGAKEAFGVWEFPAGTIETAPCSVGDYLDPICTSDEQ
jgi:hypothetical protein